MNQILTPREKKTRLAALVHGRLTKLMSTTILVTAPHVFGADEIMNTALHFKQETDKDTSQ